MKKERKTRTIQVRITEAQYGDLERLGEFFYETVSQLVRGSVLSLIDSYKRPGRRRIDSVEKLRDDDRREREEEDLVAIGKVKRTVRRKK